MKERIIKLLILLCTLTYCTTICRADGIPVVTVPNDDGVTWSVFQEMATYKTCHNHINWGWNGAGNGYFYSNVLNAYNAIQYDSNLAYLLPSGQNYNFYSSVKYFPVWH